MSFYNLNANCAFCGGAQCKYCGNPAHWKGANAIPGLYSSWILDGVVLAMQRPTAPLMERHDHVAALSAAGIACVVNLQVLDEHRNCGPGNLPHIGLSYDPEVWMRAGFSYFHLGWPDMDVPSFDTALTVARVMATEIRLRRGVAVHCHAGLGRTGLAIACYLIYELEFAAPNAIDHVRQRRPGSVQNSKQVKFIKSFADKATHIRRAICGCREQCEQHAILDVIDFQRSFFIEDDQRLLIPKVLLHALGVVKTAIPREHKWTIAANLLKTSKMDISRGLGKLLENVTVKNIAAAFRDDAPATALEFTVYFLLYYIKEPAVRFDSLIAYRDSAPSFHSTLKRHELMLIRETCLAFELEQVNANASVSPKELEVYSTVTYLLCRHNLSNLDDAESKIKIVSHILKEIAELSSSEITSPLRASHKSSLSTGKLLNAKNVYEGGSTLTVQKTVPLAALESSSSHI